MRKVMRRTDNRKGMELMEGRGEKGDNEKKGG
jgi:hypothetical protein